MNLSEENRTNSQYDLIAKMNLYLLFKLYNFRRHFLYKRNKMIFDYIVISWFDKAYVIH